MDTFQNAYQKYLFRIQAKKGLNAPWHAGPEDPAIRYREIIRLPAQNCFEQSLLPWGDFPRFRKCLDRLPVVLWKQEPMKPEEDALPVRLRLLP